MSAVQLSEHQSARAQGHGPTLCDEDRPGLSRDLARWVRARLSGHAAEAADVVQDVWLRALQIARGGRGSWSRPWLFSVARRVLQEHYRARRRLRLQPLTVDLATVREEPLGLLASREERQVAMRWIDRLSSAEQRLLMASVQRGELQQAARHTAGSVDTIRKRVQRIRSRLRSQLRIGR
ncbi:MAG: sigma-70 family RNA polymerase sigma factor [Planctomycetota bacterium]